MNLQPTFKTDIAPNATFRSVFKRIRSLPWEHDGGCKNLKLDTKFNYKRNVGQDFHLNHYFNQPIGLEPLSPHALQRLDIEDNINIEARVRDNQ